MQDDRSKRRWEISVCGRGTIHIHYGTGSLHILEEDFLNLAADLQKTAEVFARSFAERKSLNDKRLQ